MNFLDILLIIFSAAGLLHGLAFAIYLYFFKPKRRLTNTLLALILVFMAFRIGKSILLNFGEELEPLFIFLGLAFLLVIGPLLRWYVLGMTAANFKIPRSFFGELVPFILVFSASFFVTNAWFDPQNKQVVIVFASVLIFIYLHLAFYIFLAYSRLRKVKRGYTSENLTKYHIAIFSWLRVLILGFVLIWFSYVLNIIEDTVPYIVGPIIYSLVVYFLSIKAFKLRITDIDGDVFKTNDDIVVFKQISKLIVDEKMFLESDISLSRISKSVGLSTQKVSEIINQYAKKNFNDFVNYYRIQEAKTLLVKKENLHLTISSTAFDVGFGSLSSFNMAFKKFEGITPSKYKDKNSG